MTRLDSSAENKATQLYTDIGSTSCPGKHQVILPATRFSLENDRIVIDMTAAQASKMPKMNYYGEKRHAGGLLSEPGSALPLIIAVGKSDVD